MSLIVFHEVSNFITLYKKFLFSVASICFMTNKYFRLICLGPVVHWYLKRLKWINWGCIKLLLSLFPSYTDSIELICEGENHTLRANNIILKVWIVQFNY